MLIHKSRILTPFILTIVSLIMIFGCNKTDETDNNRQVIDIDGNMYNTVQIGTQIWMKENLKTTKYRNGNEIPNINGNWTGIETDAYTWYNNDISFKDTYGALYNWYSISNENICPEGWHIPSNTEWETLASYLSNNWTAGSKMKETGTKHWISPNTDATNESGFTGLPGGYLYGNEFDGIGFYGFWWTSTEHSDYTAWVRYLFHQSSMLEGSTNGKGLGYSIRCIKD